VLTVQLAQVNHTYGRNAFLPYSAGIIQAYAQSIPEIRDNFKFLPIIHKRVSVEAAAQLVGHVDVLAISCYIWNWQWSLAFARAMKERHNCLVVLGGPQVPTRGHVPEADLIVHHEGEVAFAGILKERLTGDPVYLRIPGVTSAAGSGPPSERIANLDSITSPYMAGVFDEIMGRDDLDFHASQETHRGCPYSCTFCDWGSSVFTKVRRFSRQRVSDEIKWFSDNQIELLYNCDANFGLFKEDVEIAREMAEAKKATGFPVKFRAAYAKNSGETVKAIAGILNESGMNKGVTLSFQSMDDGVLTDIKRKNIKVRDFQDTIAHYAKAGIATYSEIILGLPSETYDTFVDGICTLLDAGQHYGLNVYPCIALENSELNDPAYREKHGIKTVQSPMPMFHSTLGSDRYQETYQLVTETKTMSGDDWMRSQMFSWIVQALHGFGLTDAIAVACRSAGVSYRTFYGGLLSKRRKFDVIMGCVEMAEHSYSKLRSGSRWEVTIPGSQISWPPEEAAFLDLSPDHEALVREVALYASTYGVDMDLLDGAASWQLAWVRSPLKWEKCVATSIFDIEAMMNDAWSGRPPVAKRLEAPASWEICGKSYIGRTWEEFAREVAWYGRKGSTWRPQVKRVQ
jgi:radical SAM superfamily enzyme YgiQ (UPF0313 family)